MGCHRPFPPDATVAQVPAPPATRGRDARQGRPRLRRAGPAPGAPASPRSRHRTAGQSRQRPFAPLHRPRPQLTPIQRMTASPLSGAAQFLIPNGCARRLPRSAGAGRLRAPAVSRCASWNRSSGCAGAAGTRPGGALPRPQARLLRLRLIVTAAADQPDPAGGAGRWLFERHRGRRQGGPRAPGFANARGRRSAAAPVPEASEYPVQYDGHLRPGEMPESSRHISIMRPAAGRSTSRRQPISPAGSAAARARSP